MKLGLEVNFDEDTLRGLPQVYARGEAAVTLAMQRAASTIQTQLRGEVRKADLGERLSKSIRSRSYPERTKSMNASALVWTNAADIINAHLKGALIRSRSGLWLAIPTEAAGKGAQGQRITPSQWERRRGLKLTMIYRPGKPSLLITEGRLSKKGRAAQSRSKTGRGRQSIVIFILVPQVKLRKRMDFNAAIGRAAASMPAIIVQNWSD